MRPKCQDNGALQGAIPRSLRWGTLSDFRRLMFHPPNIFHRFTTVKTVDERQNVLYSAYSPHLLSIHLEEGDRESWHRAQHLD